ncbi:AlbA family DNA-binding domain-containing protein [Sphingobacterium faecale]|uniref:ATP-binding protein n=1 Tax=Sphingobacterium faecale TaxID=2803775 RepID=A0ABS1R061_9SPHI|nr:ATP-binding protein [Sphingobacterium faecale]MBL1408076.1 ATP-binding protein [Sphingobacterium faecale]
MTENHRIEFKQKVTPELEREVVAFLNTKEGGIIYIGIDKNGKTTGLDNVDQE